MNSKQRQKIARKRMKQMRIAADQENSEHIRRRYRNAPDHHSRQAITCFSASLVLLAAYIALIIASCITGGKLNIYSGSAGFLAMVLSVATLVLALLSRKERRSYPLFPNLASTFAFIACICWVGTFALGMAS